MSNQTEHNDITRPSCLECAEKHLGSAWVLLTETRHGYQHELMAVGHLQEAEDETQEHPALHDAINQARKTYQQEREIPDFEELSSMLQKVIEEQSNEQPDTASKADKTNRPEKPCVHAEFLNRSPCCGGHWNCGNKGCKKHGQKVVGRYCRKRCPDQADPQQTKIAAVFTARNEGDEVRKTIDSLLDSLESADVHAFVIDDASEDGSCAWIDDDDRPVTRIRHDEPQGVGASRNAGCEAALEWGADVVSFHDAHMRFPQGGLETLAQRAIGTGNVVCGGSDGLNPNCRRWGCDLYYDDAHCLHVKWNIVGGEQWDEKVGEGKKWTRSAAPMGAGYVMSRDTIDKLSRFLGQLWDDIKGKWGFSEQDLAVKAFLMDITIEYSHDVIINHQYRKANPNGVTAKDTMLNATYSLAGLLSDDVFDTYFRPLCEKRLPKSKVEELVEEARADRLIKATWSYERELKIFTHLCGRESDPTELHPEHEWWNGHASALMQRLPGDTRHIFQWRPGAHTIQLAKTLPDTHITCVEWCQSRLHLYGPVLKRMENVDLQKVPLNNWTEPWDYIDVPPGGFDAVLATGDYPNKCQRSAKEHLAKDGHIMSSPSRDHYLLHTDNRKKAETALREYEDGQNNDQATEPGDTQTHNTTNDLPQKQSFEPVLRELLQDLQPDRVLEWGPGRSTELVHEVCPEAEIRTIESQEDFAKRAESDHPYAEVHYYEIPDYGPSRYASAPFLEDWGEFDLVFVDGRRRNECLLTASRICASDGAIILHDSQRRHYNLAADLLEKKSDHGDTLVLKPKLTIQEVA